MPAETDILPPRYDRPERIARGGMGEIYRATDSTLGRTVAIKVLADRYAQDEAIRDRFKREALAAARLSGDANTVAIFDVGEWNERPFIVMEYLAGGSLEDVLRKSGAQPPGRALAWLAQAARALDAAHATGIVHRDVKPANLLLDREGEVHVADFGIASATGMDSLTRPGTVLGTAGYLAPEQAQGARAASASDRYALAVVAFELLTGARPYAAETPTAEAMAHVNAPVPSVCDRDATLPCELDPVFERALAKDPEQRYPSCGEFVAALRDALDQAAGTTRGLAAVAPAEAATTPYVACPSELDAAAAPVRRRRTRVAPLALAGIVAATIAGVGLAAILADDDDEREAARTPQVSTLTRTFEATTPTITEQVTVTATVPAAAPRTAEEQEEGTPPTTTAAAPGGNSVNEGIALSDQAFRLMQQGNYAAALPVAQRALAMLRGSGHVYEAYANYNVGRSLAETGQCSAALPYIDRSEALQGHRREFDVVRRMCG